MERRRFGSTKREVSTIGQGTWYIDEANRATAIAALRQGLDLGMNSYRYRRDVWIGRRRGDALRGDCWATRRGLPGANASRSGTVAACERSLARLKTDRLDCYLLHWRGAHPLEDTIAGFDQLQSEGKILSWGVSNFDAPDLDEVRKIAGKGHPACNQVLYHLGARAIEHAVIPWCEENGVAVVAYSPFGHRGALPGPRTAGGRVLKDIAAAHDATPHQVALWFLVRRPSLFAIPKASRPEHAAENARAGDLRLTEADLARIDEAFPLGHRTRALPVM